MIRDNELPEGESVTEDRGTGAEGGPPLPGRKTWKIGTLVYTRAGLASLLGWLLWGDFAWQMRERAVVPVAQLLLKHLHASDRFVGLLVGSVPSALGLIIGPVLSTLSDRHRGRRGRRIPFLLAPTPFAVLALVGLAFAPALGRNVHGWLGPHAPSPGSLSLTLFALFWSVFEVAAITTSGIFYALINDVVPHELIGRSFGLFRAVSLLAGILFNYWLIGRAEQHFQAIFIGVAMLYGVGLTLMCLKVTEGAYPPPEPLERRRVGDLLGPVKTYFRDTFSDPYYRWVYVATTLAVLAAGPVNTFSVFYAKSIHLSMGVYGKYLVLTYVISFCLSYLLGWLADRLHPLRIATASIGLYAAATLWGGVFARTTGTFAVAFVAHGVLSGCLFTSIVPTFQLLFPKARFGEFYSATNVLTGLCSVVLPPAVGAMLDATGHVYRNTFLVAGCLGSLAFLGMLVVHGKFMALGGPKNYVAPE